jgi:hypothetical protein
MLRINPDIKFKMPTYVPSKKDIREDLQLSVIEEAKKLMGRMDDFRQIDEYHVAAAYSSIYTKVSKERKNFIRDIDRHRDFYLVDVMVNSIVQDALTPEISTGKIVEITSSNSALKNELEALQKRINFDQLLLDILPDLCLYGDYFLKTNLDDPEDDQDHKKIAKDQLDDEAEDIEDDDKLVSGTDAKGPQGLLEVKDVVDQTAIIPLTQDGKRRSYLTLDKGKVVKAHARHYIHFTMGGSRRRLQVFEELSRGVAEYDDRLKEVLEDVPRYIRVGKSIFYGTLSKIRELELLEKLIPAAKLSKLSQGTIVGVNLPENYDLEKGLAAVRRVEGLLNKKIGVDNKLNELTVESIIATSGQYKAIPLYGEKGRIERIDYKEDQSDDLLSNLKDIREIICDSIGVPYELVFKSDDVNRGNIIRKYARYLKKLKSVQRALQDGIRQIVKIHLAARDGISYKDSDLQINFLSKLPEIDNLDNLEHMDITISMLGNLLSRINEFSDDRSAFDIEVDPKVLKDYVNNHLATIGLTNLIKDMKIKVKPEPEDNSSF